MNDNIDLERRVAAWIDGQFPKRAPGDLLGRVLDTTGRRRPRPAWIGRLDGHHLSPGSSREGIDTSPGRQSWRPARAMADSTLKRLALATAVLVAVAVVGVSIFGQSAVIGPSVGAPSATPAHGPSGGPIPLPSAGPLAPGTYSVANPCTGACADYRRIIFTLPAGWASSDGLIYKHLGQSGEVSFSAWTVDQVYADPCHWQGGVLPSAPGAADLAERLQRQAGTDGSAPTPATLGGVFALRVELSVPAQLDVATCDMGQFRRWTEWQVVDGANSRNAAGQVDAVYVVDVDRRPLVIDASHMPATSREDLAELQTIFASMFIDGSVGVAAQPADSTAVLTGPGGATQVPDSLLAPGTYAYLDVDHQGFNVSFTVPAGWTWNGRYLSRIGLQPSDGAGAIFFFGGPVQVYADPCHWAGAQPTPPSGDFADDLTTALTAQPRRSPTTPIDRPAASEGLSGRWPGKSVVLQVPDDVDFAACDGGQYRSWGPDDKARSHQGPGQRDLVWAVDINGGLIVDAASFSNTPSGVMTEMDAILASVVTGHWG